MEKDRPPIEAGLPPISRATRIVAGLPLPSRRRVVRTLFAVATLLRRAPRSNLGRVFERVLRLPHAEAAALDRRAALFDILAEIEWIALLLRSVEGIRRDLESVSVSDADLLARVAATGRPVVLAPLHMGAYVAALAAIMLRFFPDRPLLILRRRDDMARETRVMERIRAFGIDMRFLNVGRRGDFVSAVRYARKGAVIVAFCDLPPSYGVPAAMPMFGLATRFAFGIDGFARLTDAIVVPMASRSGPGGEDVRFGAPFEVGQDSAEERARAAEHIRRHIRATLMEAPEQWHLWSTLDEYLPSPERLSPEARLNRPGELAEAAE